MLMFCLTASLKENLTRTATTLLQVQEKNHRANLLTQLLVILLFL